jgi:uncharacterized protein (TIGR02118 family)
MVKLVFCLNRRSDVTEEEFHRLWRDEHAPLVRSHAGALGIRRYVQSHTAHPSVNGALAAARDAPADYDGVAELWFDGVDELITASTSSAGVAAGEALLADERRFIDHSRSPIFLVDEHIVI